MPILRMIGTHVSWVGVCRRAFLAAFRRWRDFVRPFIELCLTRRVPRTRKWIDRTTVVRSESLAGSELVVGSILEGFQR